MFGFPLLLIPLAICNIVALMMSGVGFDAPVAKLSLPSGADWALSLGDVLLALGVVLLLLEIVRAARAGKFVTDHLLSLLIFAAAAAEFAMLPQFGNSTVFLLTLMALADFFAGLALRGRRRLREAAAGPAVAIEPAPRIEPAPEGHNDLLPGTPPPVRPSAVGASAEHAPDAPRS